MLFSSHLCTCKNLKHVDLSYNSFDKNSILELFNQCLKIESAQLVVNDQYEANVNVKNASESLCWFDLIKMKLNQVNSVPFKCIELKIDDQLECSRIKSFFKNEYQKTFVNFFYHTKNVFEIRIDYVSPIWLKIAFILIFFFLQIAFYINISKYIFRFFVNMIHFKYNK